MRLFIANARERCDESKTCSSNFYGKNPMTYPSKQDIWLILVVAVAGFALLGATAHNLFFKGINHPAAWILTGATILYLAVIFVLAYPVSYEIAPPFLIIRSGLFQSRIALSSIESVKPSRNPASAPAWSLDRLQINYQKKGKPAFTLVSPNNKQSFLNELIQSTGGLRLEADGVVRDHTSRND
jgi:hypothetical protein